MRNWLANIIEGAGLRMVLFSKRIRPKKKSELLELKEQIYSALKHLDKQEASIVEQVSKVMEVLK